ncbi:MAG: hypothetical protein M1826_001636 [Phylliscum demangeonii]|nr:MAG: hypothetical protein M1826_001636 [Phylliscum demangeonii]
MSASILLPDQDPPICPARPKIGPGLTPDPLLPADNLEAILVVDTDVRLACQSTGSGPLLPGEWVAAYLSPGVVHDYGQVLRRQTRLALFGMALPSVFDRLHSRRMVLPSMRDVLSSPSDNLGPIFGRYSIIFDVVDDKHALTNHIFDIAAASGDRDVLFRGTSPATPARWLPESLTGPTFIAPKAADAIAGVAIKAYRVWGNLDPLPHGACAAQEDRTARYRALFLLYGPGNSVSDGGHGFQLPPVCHGSGDKVLTGDRRFGGLGRKLAFLAPHKARPTTQ